MDAEISFAVGATMGSSTQSTPSGYMLRTLDSAQVIRITLQSLAVHQLRPYTTWETLKGLLDRLYQEFSKEVPVAPEALGVRYVNRIDIPASAPIEEYCRTYIEISRDLPQGMDQYILRIEQTLGDAKLITQSTFVPSESPDFTCLIMDFDFRHPIPEGRDFSELLPAARELKNRVFNQSFTDLMKKQFL